MMNLKFNSFNSVCNGRMITQFGDVAILQSRNPYGSHNLVAVTIDESGEIVAFRHGNLGVFDYCSQWAPKKQLRKVFRYLVKKGVVNTSGEIQGVENYKGERCE